MNKINCNNHLSKLVTLVKTLIIKLKRITIKKISKQSTTMRVRKIQITNN